MRIGWTTKGLKAKNAPGNRKKSNFIMFQVAANDAYIEPKFHVAGIFLWLRKMWMNTQTHRQTIFMFYKYGFLNNDVNSMSKVCFRNSICANEMFPLLIALTKISCGKMVCANILNQVDVILTNYQQKMTIMPPRVIINKSY